MARKIQPRNKVPKPKRGQSSEDYWRERESRQRAENIRNEAKTAERINRIFQSMQDSIQQEIEVFYQRYASKEGITITEARGRVSRIDMEQYERLAKKYVEAAHHGDEDLAFSQEANDQMRLYNAAMRINRLEMLKARCGIRAMEGYRDTERLINENLEERAYSEYRRLAGILGNSVQFNENMVRAIVNASYQNATWSQRLWNHQASLSSQIGTQLASGILAGKSSTVLAREIQKLTGGSTYACQRLMRTELRRVQTEAALQSMTDNGVTEYKFMVENGVNPCDECLALDGQVFELPDMNVGKNAPPIHPACHCASAPHVDEAKWQRWLDGPAQAGVPWAEFNPDISDQTKLLQKYGSLENMMFHGSNEDLKRWSELSKQTGLGEKDILRELAKKADNWEQLMNMQSESKLKSWADELRKIASPAELGAVRMWSGETYSDINQLMRFGTNKGSAVAKAAENLYNLLNRMTTKEDIYVRRGTGIRHILDGMPSGWRNDLSLLNGKEFKDAGFTATSPSSNGGFSGCGENNAELFIRVPKGTHGAYIGEVARAENEKEFLLQKGYKYRIVKAERRPNKYFPEQTDLKIWVEVVLGE